mgnify:CR=1 FL=1
MLQEIFLTLGPVLSLIGIVIVLFISVVILSWILYTIAYSWNKGKYRGSIGIPYVR